MVNIPNIPVFMDGLGDGTLLFLSATSQKNFPKRRSHPPPRSHAGGISRRTGAIFGHSCHRGVFPSIVAIWMLGVVHFFGVLGCCFFVDLPSGNLTKQWKIHHLKMYFLFEMGIFHCYVCLPEGNWWKKLEFDKDGWRSRESPEIAFVKK